MDALNKAFSAVERSYLSAKAAVGNMADGLMSRGPAGISGVEQPGFRNAKEQLAAFRSWVFAAIRPICNRIAAQPVRVAKGKQGGRYGTKATDHQPMQTHPILDLLADPNDLMTGWGMMWATVASINLCGRAFWWVPEGNQECYLLPASWIKGFEGTARFQSWRVQPEGTGEFIDLPSERVVYFAFPDPGSPWGSISPLASIAEAVSNDADILLSQRSAFRRGIHPTHAIIVGKDPVDGVPGGLRPRLTHAQQRQIIEAVRKRYAGAERHGEPLILDGLIEDIKRLSLTPEELDWQQSAVQMKERILQGFGVSPYILGGSEPGSRAASTAAEMHFLATTVNPLIRMMSEAMTEWLAPMFGGGLRVWIEEAVCNDDEQNLRWATLLAQMGVLTAHELRRLAPFGLPEDDTFDGTLVGGQNLGEGNLIERGLSNMTQRVVSNYAADELLERAGLQGNGKV